MTDPKDALPPRLDPTCTCVCHTQPGVVHFAPCCRETDPKDAEIARLTARAENAEAERDAIAAAVFEAAAGLPRDPNWVWRFEPRWSARDLSEAIRALTPADAKAALDARINAAREEGRVMGLREALAMAEDHTPDKHALGGPAPHVTGKSIQNAILAKIKETDHE